MQYNYSHDNDGAGYLLAHGRPRTRTRTTSSATTSARTTAAQQGLRRDPRLGPRPQRRDLQQHGVGVDRVGAVHVRAIVSSWSVPQNRAVNVHFRNNIFVSSGGVPLVDVDDVHALLYLQFQGNIYFAATNQWILYGRCRVHRFRELADCHASRARERCGCRICRESAAHQRGGGVRTRGRHAAGNARRLPAAARVTGDRRGAESGGVRHCDWRPRLLRHLAASRQRGRYRRRGTAICSEFARGFQRGRQT